MAVLEIHKKGNKNFLHIYNGNEVIASETDIKFVGDIVKITLPNSAPLFLQQGFNYNDIEVYNEIGVLQPFNTKEELNQILINIGYIAYSDQQITMQEVEDYVNSLPKYHEFACSDEESDLEVATVYNQRLLRAFNDVTRIDFGVKTAPTGSMIVLDVLKNGVSIFTTKPRIDIGAFTTLVPPSGMPDQEIIGGSVNFAQGDLLTVKIDQVGSTTAGTNLKAQITYK